MKPPSLPLSNAYIKKWQEERGGAAPHPHPNRVEFQGPWRETDRES